MDFEKMLEELTAVKASVDKLNDPEKLQEVIMGVLQKQPGWKKVTDPNFEMGQGEGEGKPLGKMDIDSIVKSVDSSLHAGSAHRGQYDLMKEVQRLNDHMLIAAKIKRVPIEEVKGWQAWDNPVFGFSELRKAMDTTTAGSGLEWIPTGYSTDLVEQVNISLKVAALHRVIPMPRDPFIIPRIERGTRLAYAPSENTAPTATKPDTANITLTAKRLMTLFNDLSYELDEDSIVAIMPALRDDIVLSLGEALEDAIINGDTTATHMDTDTEAAGATDRRTIFDGYRDVAESGAKVDHSNAVLTEDAVRNLRANMGKYGVDPSKLAIVVGINEYIQMMHRTNFPSFITLEKYGPNAVVLQGELGRFDNIPVLVSEFIREDLNASGVNDGVTTDRTELIMVRRDAFLIGDRRAVLVENDRDIEKQSFILTASMRKAFSEAYGTSETTVGILYNVDKI